MAGSGDRRTGRGGGWSGGVSGYTPWASKASRGSFIFFKFCLFLFSPNLWLIMENLGNTERLKG